MLVRFTLIKIIAGGSLVGRVDKSTIQKLTSVDFVNGIKNWTNVKVKAAVWSLVGSFYNSRVKDRRLIFVFYSSKC